MTRERHTELFLQYSRGLVGFARSFVFDDAEDIVQDVFIRVKDLDDDNPKSLLYTMVKNACLNWIDQNKNRKKRCRDYVADNGFAEAMEIKSGLMELVCKEIETLPTQQKKILKLLSIGFNQVEIADILGLKPATVATNIFRFRQQIKPILKERFS